MGSRVRQPAVTVRPATRHRGLRRLGLQRIEGQAEDGRAGLLVPCSKDSTKPSHVVGQTLIAHLAGFCATRRAQAGRLFPEARLRASSELSATASAWACSNCSWPRRACSWSRLSCARMWLRPGGLVAAPGLTAQLEGGW